MMVLYVGHLLYDDYTIERIYDVLYVYKVHYTLPERIRYNRIMHLWKNLCCLLRIATYYYT